jgi:hypothetical protein
LYVRLKATYSYVRMFMNVEYGETREETVVYCYPPRERMGGKYQGPPACTVQAKSIAMIFG